MHIYPPNDFVRPIEGLLSLNTLRLGAYGAASRP